MPASPDIVRLCRSPCGLYRRNETVARGNRVLGQRAGRSCPEAPPRQRSTGRCIGCGTWGTERRPSQKPAADGAGEDEPPTPPPSSGRARALAVAARACLCNTGGRWAGAWGLPAAHVAAHRRSSSIPPVPAPSPHPNPGGGLRRSARPPASADIARPGPRLWAGAGTPLPSSARLARHPAPRPRRAPPHGGGIPVGCTAWRSWGWHPRRPDGRPEQWWFYRTCAYFVATWERQRFVVDPRSVPKLGSFWTGCRSDSGLILCRRTV